MTLPYSKNTWVDEILADDPRYDILEDGGAAFKADMQINLATTVTQAGTPLNASRMNNIEGAVQSIADFLLYKLAVSVSANDLIVTLQHADGTNPTSTRPLFFRIGGTWRSVTTTTTITIADGTNYFNAGSAELGTKLVGYFPYVIWDSNSSVVALSIARIPYGRVVTDFSSTTTNEKHLFNYANFSGTDNVANIGYFEATLSLTPFTWTVPTFTNANLINEPIFETRWLDWTADFPTSTAMTVTGESIALASYKIDMNRVDYQIRLSAFTIGGTPNTIIINTLPFDAANDFQVTGAMLWVDAGGNGFGGCRINGATPDQLYWLKYNFAAWAAGAGTALNGSGFYEI